MNFGMRKLFGHKRMPKKFGSKQDRINGTSFTAILFVQKLAKILEKYWLDELVPKLVERGFMVMRMSW